MREPGLEVAGKGVLLAMVTPKNKPQGRKQVPVVPKSCHQPCHVAISLMMPPVAPLYGDSYSRELL